MKNNFEENIKNKIEDLQFKDIANTLNKKKAWKRIKRNEKNAFLRIPIFSHAAAVLFGILIASFFLYKDKKVVMEHTYNQMSALNNKLIFEEEKQLESLSELEFESEEELKVENFKNKKSNAALQKNNTSLSAVPVQEFEDIDIGSLKLKDLEPTEIEPMIKEKMEHIDKGQIMVNNGRKVVHWKKVEQEFVHPAEADTNFLIRLNKRFNDNQIVINSQSEDKIFYQKIINSFK